MIRCFIVVILMLQLISCASVPEKSAAIFDLSGRDGLYAKTEWSFKGRIAIIDKDNAVSANITWERIKNKENIVLAGLFGMGKARITLEQGRVEIESAGKQSVYYGNASDIVYSKLGIRIPVTALKFWVLGVVDPNAAFVVNDTGFEQHGWLVTYLQMQVNDGNELPRKIRVEQGSAKLKLIVNQWEI